MASDDEDEVDLGVSLETVAEVADLARALHEKEEAALNDDPDEDGDDERDDDEEDDEDEISEETLTDLITALDEDEQAGLIALAWVGRGDYEAEEWDEALALATERNEKGDAAAYLTGLDNLADMLGEGLAAFGIAIEEIEY